MRFCLRVRASLTYGWGHMLRAYTLARFLARDETTEVTILLTGDRAACAYADGQPLPHAILPAAATAAEEEAWLYNYRADVLIVDVLEIGPEQLRRYRRCSRRLVLFNDMGAFHTEGDIIIIPQLLDRYPDSVAGQQHLTGPDYFILSESLHHHLGRKPFPSGPPLHLLVVLGGAVRAPLYKKVTAIVERLDPVIGSIDLILGYDQDFDPQVMACDPRVRLIAGTNDIGSFMARADLALAASGYVKYELAAVGTPMVLVSIVEHQDVLGRTFAAQGKCAIFAGNIATISPADVADELHRLTRDAAARRTMSHCGQALVDGKGLARIGRAVMQPLPAVDAKEV